jgi:hypothetical protein
MRANVRWPSAGPPAGFLAVLSLGAAAIHFAVIADHLREWWLSGVFFAALGWFQALWPIGYLLQPSRRVVWLGIVINLATVVVWTLTRTIGLPFGPAPGVPEGVGAPDALATALELSLVIGLLVTRGRAGPPSLDREWSSPMITTLAAAAIVVGATSAAIAVGGG